MPAIVEFPQVVLDALEQFADLFDNECQRRHFAEYLTGLLIAQRKTVRSIQKEFANSTDQSCLNKFLNKVLWDAQELNEQRLRWLQEDQELRYTRRGVIALDNVLIDHHGKLIEDVGWFWDHAEKRNKIAHDYVFSNFVAPSGKHYPLEFRRFKKQDQCEEQAVPFRNHTELFLELVDWAVEREIPGDLVFDSYFTNARILNHIHSIRDGGDVSRAYVGDLKFNRKVQWKGKIQKAEQLAASIPASDRKRLGKGERQQWYFSSSMRIPDVDHKVRLLFLWKRKNADSPRKILVTNRTQWEVTRIQRTYRLRWTGTETFHRDAKQQLGMGDCQLRNGQGQTRHMYMVMLAYSLLVRQLRHCRSQEWATVRLNTIGEACRALTQETMRSTISWVVEQVRMHNQDPEELYDRLGLA